MLINRKEVELDVGRVSYPFKPLVDFYPDKVVLDASEYFENLPKLSYWHYENGKVYVDISGDMSIDDVMELVEKALEEASNICKKLKNDYLKFKMFKKWEKIEKGENNDEGDGLQT